MTRIFISYSLEDREVARRLTQGLRGVYDSVWYDTNLSGGRAWWAGVLKQLAQADVLLYLLSRNAIRAEYCQAELTEARRLQKPIIPVLIDALTPIPQEVRHLQVVDLSAGTDQEGMRRLRAAIDQSVRRLPKTPLAPLWTQPTPVPHVAPQHRTQSRYTPRRTTELLIAAGMVGIVLTVLAVVALLLPQVLTVRPEDVTTAADTPLPTLAVLPSPTPTHPPAVAQEATATPTIVVPSSTPTVTPTATPTRQATASPTQAVRASPTPASTQSPDATSPLPSPNPEQVGHIEVSDAPESAQHFAPGASQPIPISDNSPLWEGSRLVSNGSTLRGVLAEDAIIVVMPATTLTLDVAHSSHLDAGLMMTLTGGSVFVDTGNWQRAIVVLPAYDMEVQTSGSRLGVNISETGNIVTAYCFAGRCTVRFVAQGVLRDVNANEQIIFNFLAGVDVNAPVLPISPDTIANYDAACRGCLASTIEAVVASGVPVNLRSGPGVERAVVGTVSPNARLTVIGRTADSSWLKVQTGTGEVGWLAASLVASQGNLAVVPVMEDG